MASLASRRAISVLPTPVGPDHDDVLGDDFFGQLGRELLAAHAIAQGDGDGALGLVLSDDIFVEFGDDFARRQFVERDAVLLRRLREDK